jgi:hypothetical protein
MNTPLGFSDNPIRPTKISVAKEGDSLWHFWDSANAKILPITTPSLTGYLLDVDCVEITGDYGTTEKLTLKIKADRDYEIVCGLNTWFSKTVLVSLAAVPIEKLKEPLTLSLKNDRGSKVILATISHTAGVIRSNFKWKDDKGNYNPIDCKALIEEIQMKLSNTANIPQLQDNDDQKDNEAF